jgi:hypothetical protein
VPSSIGGHGLGHIDSRSDVLTVKFELADVQREPDVAALRRGKKKSKKGVDRRSTTEVEIHLAQNTTALRSRNGDTGSVLWRIRYRKFMCNYQVFTIGPELTPSTALNLYSKFYNGTMKRPWISYLILMRFAKQT